MVELPVPSTADDADAGGSHAFVRFDTINGVVTVKNSKSGHWNRETQWQIVELYRIGGADGAPEVLFTGRLTSVSAGPGGQVFVLDPQAADVRVFDANGKYVRRFGRQGQGPGELQSPSAMAWDRQQRLWIANGFNKRYTVFDSTGSLIKTVRRPINILARPQHQMMFDRAGFLIDEGSGGGTIRFLKVDSAGSVVDTLGSIPRRARLQTRGPGMLPPDFPRELLNYLPDIVWTLAPNGTLWLAQSGELRLINTTIKGDTIRIIETSHRDNTLDRATEARVQREFSKAGYVLPEDYLVRPVVAAIHVLADGYLLVQIVDKVGVDSDLFDVFDPEGRYLGSVRTGFGLSTRSIPAFVGDTIIGVTLGELDVPFLVRGVIKR